MFTIMNLLLSVALITAYTACDSGMRCDGITASGRHVNEGITIAADWDYHEPGSWVHIDGLGYRRVDDRGNGVKGPNRFDVYMSSLDAALEFGAQSLEYEALQVFDDTGALIRKCSVAPMNDGLYTARHCLVGLNYRHTVYMGHQRVYTWSLDPARDLAHIPLLGRPGAVLRHPGMGEHAEYRAQNGNGTLLSNILVQMGSYVFREWCHTGGDQVRRGASGSGIYSEAGDLLGIVVAASMRNGEPVAIRPEICNNQQVVLAVDVP